jgi:HEAT repeat protein
MAKNDSRARDFLAGKLPSLIVDQLPRDAQPVGPVWANAVRLAGQLKIAEAVPALKQALTHPPVPGGYDSKYKGLISATFATEARLDLDIVGRALADIGDASVPILADILSNGDYRARLRAIWILWNINSPAAQKAMRDHLPSESDPGLRGLVERLLLHAPQ